jgi:hypothetical protein
MSPIAITRSRYPVHPGGDVLKLYNRLFEEAQFLNRSRGQYAGTVARQREHIAQLQAELQDFQSRMDLSLRQKAELNKILVGYGQVLKELEGAGRDLEDAFEKNGAWGLFSGTALVEAVRAFISTFRLAMNQSREARQARLQEQKGDINVAS